MKDDFLDFIQAGHEDAIKFLVWSYICCVDQFKNMVLTFIEA